jgi:hypothetical protein
MDPYEGMDCMLLGPEARMLFGLYSVCLTRSEGPAC